MHKDCKPAMRSSSHFQATMSTTSMGIEAVAALGLRPLRADIDPGCPPDPSPDPMTWPPDPMDPTRAHDACMTLNPWWWSWSW